MAGVVSLCCNKMPLLGCPRGEQLLPDLKVQIGEVIMGVVGGQNSAYGLPVNYATRLCDAAEPGQTLVCDAVLASAPGVRTEPYQPLHLQGFGENCCAHLLLPPLNAGPRTADES